MNGKKFFREIQDDYGHVADRIIWITGYASDPETRRFLEGTGQPILEKPYELVELLTFVKDFTGNTS